MIVRIDLNDRMSDLMIEWMRLNDEVKNEMVNMRLMDLKNDSVDLMLIGSVLKMKFDWLWNRWEWLRMMRIDMNENEVNWTKIDKDTREKRDLLIRQKNWERVDLKRWLMLLNRIQLC